MSSPKHHESSIDDQGSAKSDRPETEESIQYQQQAVDYSNLSESFGDFRITVKPRSMSKAPRNDPHPRLQMRGPPRTSDSHLEEDQKAYSEDEEEEDDDDDDDVRSDFDPYSEFQWLEPIDVSVTSTSTLNELGKPEQVAYCQAKLIRRDQIRGAFYSEMEQPSIETSMLGFDLFDRYGRLRPEFKTHPIIKGTGVWGKELDQGDILLIEEIFVEKIYRRKRLGRRMVEILLTLTRQKTKSFFAFARPALLKLAAIELEFENLQDDVAREELEYQTQDRAILFWRSLGFRRVGSTTWFAMTPNNQHPSHRLTAREDFDLPRTPRTTLHPLLDPFEQIKHHSLTSQDYVFPREPPRDQDLLRVLQNCFREESSDDMCWVSADEDGDTVLHLAAREFHVACVEWILNQDFGPQLLQSRNRRGETPLDSLRFKLEKLRTQRIDRGITASVSDQFRGHNENAVRCLILLKGMGSAESFGKLHGLEALQQLFGGCTCGKCLEGILSPRALHALLIQASEGHEMLQSELQYETGSNWVCWSERYLRFLPSGMQNKLGKNGSMRQGFVNLWKHIANCLRRRSWPSEDNIMGVIRNANEWPPITQDFLRRGGTVESVFLAICRNAIEADELTGDGHYQDRHGDEIADLPECRNDLEWGYLSGACGYRRISLIHYVDVMGNTLDENGSIIDSLL